MSTLKGGVMRKLLFVFIMGILAGTVYGEEAGILPEGELRFSESHNIGTHLVSWSFGAEFAPSDWFNLQAMWTSGLKVHPDIGFGSLYVGAKSYVLGEGALLSSDKLDKLFRVSAALGVLIPPGGDEEPDLLDQDQKLWGWAYRLYFDFLIHRFFYIDLYFENVFYPPQYQNDNLEEYRDWVRHYHDYTWELEGHFSYPLEGKDVILKAGVPLRFFCAPYMNASDEYATSQYFLSTGLYVGAQFLPPSFSHKFEMYLKYNAHVLGQNIEPVHKVSITAKVTFALKKSKNNEPESEPVDSE